MKLQKRPLLLFFGFIFFCCSLTTIIFLIFCSQLNPYILTYPNEYYNNGDYLSLNFTPEACNKFIKDSGFTDQNGNQPKLINLSEKDLTNKTYSSIDEAINNYPWLTQYFFISGGEPYCFLPTYKNYSINYDLQEKLSDGSLKYTYSFDEINNKYNGFLIVKKTSDNKYYVDGVYGIYGN